MYEPMDPPPYSDKFPQPGPPPVPSGPPEVVAINRPPPTFGPTPQASFCPHCHAEVVSKIETLPSTATHLIALLICAVGGCCCAWIPYVTESCQNRNHSCPNCNAYLGTYKS